MLVIALVSISLVVITIDYRQGSDGPLSSIGSTFKGTMAPLQRVVSAVTRPIGDVFSGIAHLPSLSRENRELKEQLATDRAGAATGAYDRSQMRELQALLGLRNAFDPEPLAATVIASPPSNFEWSVTIDQGSDAGVEENMPVIVGTADAPMLVGHVVSVSSGSADVQLLIDRRSKAAAALTSSNETGLISGQGDEDLRLEWVDTGVNVTAEEPVFTLSYEVPGGTSLYPSGLLIGNVSRAVPADSTGTEFVEVRPAVDFATLETVLVLRSGSVYDEEAP